ncbi:MAG: N-acetylmuramoyl-L-alanine amidase [Acidimicrobiia bacterium]
MLTIVTRDEGGLVAARSNAPVLDIRTLIGLALHHSGSAADFSTSAGNPKAYVQNLQRYSMQEKGLSDIAYNYVVIADGVVLEGRGLRHRSGANGTADGNVKYAAVLFPGDYRTGKNTLTSAQITSFRRLRQFILGVATQAKDLKPHGFFKPTECPGQNIISSIPALSQLPSSPGLPPPRPALRRGSTGASVRCLQRTLNNWGGASLAVDGVFGPVTEAAVLRYQKAHGLVQDGVVGNQTWRSLERYGGCEAD